jgi:predicted nucleic acid-binding protein
MPVSPFLDTNVLICALAENDPRGDGAEAADTHDAALRIARRHGFHIYDALVVASALEANCDTLYTEDLQDGQLVEERLNIRNPFSPSL